MSMQGYAATGLLQETAAVVASPAGAPTTSHGGGADAAVDRPPDPPSNPSPYSSFDVNSHFSPIMIIILVVLMSAFLFMGFFAIYVRRCAGGDSFSRRGISFRRDQLPTTVQRGCGVDSLMIESYPIVSYAAAKKKGCSECVVCLADFEGGEELKQLPKCKHVFHPGCISSWLESHTTCPLCRRSLVNSDRWSLSFRWGGSSRGASLSTRLNDGGGSRSRSRRGGETASPRTVGWAGSSRGWQLWATRRNEDGGSQGSGQEEATPDASSPSCELAPCGLPASPPSSDQVVTRGLPPSPLSGLSPTASIDDPSPSECQTGTELLQPISPMSSEVETSASLLSAEVAVQRRGGMRTRQAGRRRLSRSNSTGHSLRKGVVSRAAMQVPAGAVVGEWGPAAVGSCMPLSACSLHRSRSMGLDGHEEEAAAMVEPGSATSTDQRPVSGGSWSTSAASQPARLHTRTIMPSLAAGSPPPPLPLK